MRELVRDLKLTERKKRRKKLTGGRWVTVKGTHVYVKDKDNDGDLDIVTGPDKLTKLSYKKKGKKKKGDGKKTGILAKVADLVQGLGGKAKKFFTDKDYRKEVATGIKDKSSELAAGAVKKLNPSKETREAVESGDKEETEKAGMGILGALATLVAASALGIPPLMMGALIAVVGGEVLERSTSKMEEGTEYDGSMLEEESDAMEKFAKILTLELGNALENLSAKDMEKAAAKLSK